MSVPPKRRFTFFVVPEKTAKIHSFSLPTRALQAGAVVLSFGLVFFMYFAVDYIDSKGKMRELRSLREEVRNQRIDLQSFAGKLSDLDGQLGKLRQFDAKLRIIANLEPPRQTEAILGTGGSTPEMGDYLPYISGLDRDLLERKMRSDLDDLKEKANTQEKSFAGLLESLQDQKTLFASTPSIWPTRGWVTSGFGYRPYPFTGDQKMHEGMDIATRMGTSIVAPANGIVTFVGTEGSFGNTIVIDHGYGKTTRYGHLSEIYVRIGQRVRRDEKIASVGNTGRSTGPHLHYEVRIHGVPVNPVNYILD